MTRVGKTVLILGAAGMAAWLVARARAQLATFRYAGKVVVVTGGSRGLGLVLARQLADAGARVAICARGADDLARASDDLARHSPRPMALVCDVGNPDSVQRFIRAVEHELGPVDVLINNAGTIAVGPLESMTRDDYEAALAVHFWGPYNCVNAVLPTMRWRRAGRIVNISSIGGKISVPHLAPYSASKFALVGYSQGLRAELAKDGIVVTTVCPGLMRTGSPRNALFKGENAKEYAWFSISDSLPLLTISAERAAEQILEACRQGVAEVVLTVPAKAAVLLSQLLPGLSATLLGLTSRMLPSSGDTRTHLGQDSTSVFAPSLLTTLSDRAAAQNNEIGAGSR